MDGRTFGQGGTRKGMRFFIVVEVAGNRGRTWGFDIVSTGDLCERAREGGREREKGKRDQDGAFIGLLMTHDLMTSQILLSQLPCF